MLFSAIPPDHVTSEGMLQRREPITHSVYGFTYLQANEMLLAGRKLTAAEAYERGLITRIFPQEEFKDRANQAATEIANLPPQVQ